MQMMEVKKTCYCCKDKSESESMDLDSALNELGMLSVVTESRKQYLRECQSSHETELKSAENVLSKRHSFEVIRFNPNYVTKLTIGRRSGENSHWRTANLQQESTVKDFGKNHRTPIDRVQLEAQSKRLERFRRARIRRCHKPYHVPWRLANQTFSSSHDEDDTYASQSKSNSSSPVKYTSNSSITRSRSFDNLDCAVIKLADFIHKPSLSLHKQEMDRVSAILTNLQVTE